MLLLSIRNVNKFECQCHHTLDDNIEEKIKECCPVNNKNLIFFGVVDTIQKVVLSGIKSRTSIHPLNLVFLVVSPTYGT